MKIAVGSDHGGFKAKEALKRSLTAEGHTVVDMGTDSEDRVDYPDHASAVARAVSGGKVDRGVLICGTGIGMSIAANKVKGIRAALVWNKKTAALAYEHNKANILCLGARMHPAKTIVDLTRLWLRTPFGESRHTQRINKITRLERKGG